MCPRRGPERAEKDGAPVRGAVACSGCRLCLSYAWTGGYRNDEGDEGGSEEGESEPEEDGEQAQ